MGDEQQPTEWCNECAKGLRPGEVYIWNGMCHCVSCINIVSARSAGWGGQQ